MSNDAKVPIKMIIYSFKNNEEDESKFCRLKTNYKHDGRDKSIE